MIEKKREISVFHSEFFAQTTLHRIQLQSALSLNPPHFPAGASGGVLHFLMEILTTCTL
jgi:hypothetical protein